MLRLVMVYTSLLELAGTFREQAVSAADGGYRWLVKNESADQAVILVHGLTGCKADMAVLGTEYAARGYAVYAPDMPGHGAAAPLDPTGFGDLGDWLHGFVGVIGRVPALVVGNSFGSAICYAYAARDHLPAGSRLVLACPTPRVAWVTRTLAQAGGLLPAAFVTRTYTRPFPTRARVGYLSRTDDDTARRWLYESERLKASYFDAQVIHRLTRLLHAHNPYDAEFLPQDVQRRTTVLIGAADNVVPGRSIAALGESMPGLEMVVIPGAGHILHFEAPRRVADLTAGAGQRT
jgi:pimeloyl-ACP methyl ester carboxylesterase